MTFVRVKCGKMVQNQTRKSIIDIIFEIVYYAAAGKLCFFFLARYMTFVIMVLPAGRTVTIIIATNVNILGFLE